MGVQIRAPGGKLEWLYITGLDDRAKGIREFRVSVMDEVSAVLEATPFVHGHVSGNSLHPGLIGMWRDPGQLNATTHRDG